MDQLSSVVDDIFSSSGRLSHIKGFEHRPQQQAMALAVADALESGDHLMVEAPTGVGKTLAYLVPSILFALREQRRAIISTHTKNLQEQLFVKDLPIVKTLVGTSFHAEVVKGRRNYLCTTRLNNALASSPSMFSDGSTEQLQQIARYAGQSRDGDIETFPFTPAPEIWDLVCSEQGLCGPKTCGSRCFYQRLRERLRSAHVIIMNHALCFTLMTGEETEDHFIVDDDFLVLDEAHTLAAVAGNGIGTRISRKQLLGTLHRLYNPKTRKGILAKHHRHARTLCSHLCDSVGEFFDTVDRAARANESDATGDRARTIRLRTPGLVVNTLRDPLTAFHHELAAVAESNGHDAVRAEIGVVDRALVEFAFGIDEFLDQTDPSCSYWVELSPREAVLCASPVDIGDIIGPRLFKSGTSVILTSATLAVDRSLEYARSRIGAPEIRTLILDSPFDHARQMKLCLARDIPAPDAAEYQDQLPAWILRSIDRTQGKALVLFTNAVLMQGVATTMKEMLADRGIRLLVQGTELPRHELLEAFKADVHSVLFGLDSFWMGIDVPGEALEHVIITRLPFAAPNHPLIEARLEAIARRGGQPFFEATLPEAVLKFRQGVGRLIRSSTDRGAVTVLDSRILHKQYGRAFVDSLPPVPVEILTEDGEAQPLSRGDW